MIFIKKRSFILLGFFLSLILSLSFITACSKPSTATAKGVSSKGSVSTAIKKNNALKDRFKQSLLEPYFAESINKSNKVNDKIFSAYIRKNKGDKYAGSCEVFLNLKIKQAKRQKLNESKVVKCFEGVSTEHFHYLVSKVLSYKPAISKPTLSKILPPILYQEPLYPQDISNLIAAGADTKNINLDHIRWGNTRICQAINIVLKNNKKHYQNVFKTKSKPYHREALIELSKSGLEIDLCDKEIQLLASYNPALLNYKDRQGTTPLGNYIADPNWDDWNIKTAKMLITKKNINVQGRHGYTPLFSLGGNSSTRRSPYDKAIIKEAIAKGADLSIKNKEGLSYAGYILTKRPDLLEFVKDGKKLHACFTKTYKGLGRILSTREKQVLKKVNFYLTPKLSWLEKRIIQQFPLPSTDKCTREYFSYLGINKTVLMARSIVKAYVDDLQKHSY